MPARFVSFDEIVKSIDFGLQYTKKIALLGALISAHPDFEKICEYILKKKEEIPELEMSVSSLRADTITPLIVKTLAACGQRHSTIAIEAGSERLRKVINKNLSEEEIFNAVKIASENGLTGFKIYAMIGHPTETMEDIKELVDLAKKLKKPLKTLILPTHLRLLFPKPTLRFNFAKEKAQKALRKNIII